MIHFRSALELALGFKQLGLAHAQHWPRARSGSSAGSQSVLDVRKRIWFPFLYPLLLKANWYE
jgi:hypothetical protein